MYKPKKFKLIFNIKKLIFLRVNEIYCCVIRTMIQLIIQISLTATNKVSDYLVLCYGLVCSDVQWDLMQEPLALYQIRFSNSKDPFVERKNIKRLGTKFVLGLSVSSILFSTIILMVTQSKLAFILNVLFNIIAYNCEMQYQIEYFLIDVTGDSKFLMKLQTIKYIIRLLSVSLFVFANSNITAMMIGEIISLIAVGVYFNKIPKIKVLKSQEV